jgi:GntR family transcriptional regulator
LQSASALPTRRRLDKDSPIPLYYQLKEIVLEHIRQAPPGETIPTEHELCAQFDISRPTVRQALSELVSEGYLSRAKGRRTEVAKPRIRQDFLTILESYNKEMRDKGLQPLTRVLDCSVMDAEPTVAEALELTPAAGVIHLERLRFADDEPIVLVSSYLPYERLRGLENEDLEERSLYEIIERDFGFSIDRAVRTLQAELAGQMEAELLQIDVGAAIQHIDTIAYLSDGSPIEFSRAKYRGDRNRFSFTLAKR